MTSLAPAAFELILGKNTKEQSDMILEPLQVLITLAILGYCPIGTKISISQNTLYLHKPTLVQGLLRWWEGDSKDDLYYLFHAIRRFYKWYKNTDNEIFNFILELAKNGIKNLIKTYQKADKKSILHTLSLYGNILDLDTPDLFKTSEDDQESVTIDKVFENVKPLYDQKLLVIVFSTLKLIKKSSNEKDIELYISGLNDILTPTNTIIRTWIQQNLTL
tara:strand:+ start:496 stop:1152 length:657 start_codon:yes stop_codon:yes gene_type:complete